MIELHPAWPFFFAGLVIPILPKRIFKVLQLLVPLCALYGLFQLYGSSATFEPLMLKNYALHLIRIDKLSFLFTLTFIVFGFFAHLYALHSNDKFVAVFGNFYIGSSIGAVLSGDLISLFIFWEMMALASAPLILNSKRKTSSNAMFRYLLFHCLGGLFFFSGLILKITAGTTLLFNGMDLDLAGQLIFIGFAVNAALVPLHAWLPDSYPEGTPTSSIYLSAYTTKVAVYAFARGFAGQEFLITLGVVAAVFGVIYALMENDMRKLLSYHIVCQIGYMVCGIGIGSELGIAAGTGHAIGNILFKGLLFMATGALIHMTGKYRLDQLGGLAKQTKMILFFYMIGAFAIGGMPFFNGYVTKSILFKALILGHLEWLEITLTLVAIGTFLSIGLKLAWFAFAGENNSSVTTDKLPWNMGLAMFGLSLLCIGIGIWPDTFIEYLPGHLHHLHLFSIDHLLHTFGMLAGTALGFFLIVKKLHAHHHLSLDFDWFYRKGAGLFIDLFCHSISAMQTTIQRTWTQLIGLLQDTFGKRVSNDISPIYEPIFLIVAGCLIVVFFLFF